MIDLSSLLFQGVNPGDSRDPGTDVFLPDLAAFRPGQWQETNNQTIPVGLDGSHGFSLEESRHYQAYPSKAALS
jgi:hypothetical protein